MVTMDLMKADPAATLPVADLKDLTLEEWQYCWRKAGALEERRKWWNGDLFNEGRRFIATDGKTEEEIAHEILLMIPAGAPSARLIRLWGAVTRAFPPEKRVGGLTFEHHHAAAASGKAPQEQRRALQLAFKREWSEAELREYLSPSGQDEEPEVPRARFVPRLFVQESLRFIADLDPSDGPRVEAVKRELEPLIVALREKGLL